MLLRRVLSVIDATDVMGAGTLTMRERWSWTCSAPRCKESLWLLHVRLRWQLAWVVYLRVHVAQRLLTLAPSSMPCLWYAFASSHGKLVPHPMHQCCPKALSVQLEPTACHLHGRVDPATLHIVAMALVALVALALVLVGVPG